MSDKSIADKLQIKPNYSILFANAPRDYFAMLGELGTDVAVLKDAASPADVIQVFASSTYAKTLGLQAVAMISIDDTWSALRLKII